MYVVCTSISFQTIGQLRPLLLGSFYGDYGRKVDAMLNEHEGAANPPSLEVLLRWVNNMKAMLVTPGPGHLDRTDYKTYHAAVQARDLKPLMAKDEFQSLISHCRANNREDAERILQNMGEIRGFMEGGSDLVPTKPWERGILIPGCRYTPILYSL